ncbi:hypothetical protein QE152_g29690 [Popillia japonica]|uniref:Uncharacterized protein n=1 Tax=Popillia japonica TaxID=7064 RepID=A0AAW1JHH8_POPJA
MFHSRILQRYIPGQMRKIDSDEEDRHSEWMFYAADRIKFQRRIRNCAKILEPVLSETHRQKVYRKNFESFIVVDIQGIANKEFVPKEISISDGKRSVHLLFKPPTPFHRLQQQQQKEIRWLERMENVPYTFCSNLQHLSIGCNNNSKRKYGG